MTGDPSKDPNFTGVKQPNFDHLVSKHSSAASQLDSLATRLWAELNRAGLDTAPAMRIQEIARRIEKQAGELRRRQRLVHEMTRLGNPFGAGFCTRSGTYYPMPDRMPDISALLSGRSAAELARKAAEGDRKALTALKAYADQASNPEFARAFLQALGPAGFVEVPAALAKKARVAVDLGDADAAKFAIDARPVLALMSDALAVGTDPKSAAYVGDKFVNDLKVQGRAEKKVDGLGYLGYQALALVWRSHDGKPPYSPEFIKNVGVDVIRFEQDRLGSTWEARRGFLGRHLGHGQRAIPDLATTLNLGALLDSQQGAIRRDRVFKSSVVDDLFSAIYGNKESAQALLREKPHGWKHTVLQYMLTTRRDAFHDHKNYSPFQTALTNALSAKGDPVSLELTNQALNAIKGDVRSCFGAAIVTGRLEIRDPDKLARLDFLRYPLARGVAANIESASGLYYDRPEGFSGIARNEMDRLLAYMARDEASFKTLLAAQMGHARNQIQVAFSTGESVDAHISREARLMGSLLEVHRLVLIEGTSGEDEATKQRKETIAQVMSWFMTPALTRVASKGASWLGGKEADVAGMASNDLAAWIAKQIYNDRPATEGAISRAAEEKEMVARGMSASIVEAKIRSGAWSPEELAAMRGRSFATDGDPPKPKSLEELSPEQRQEFVKWIRTRTEMEAYANNARSQMSIFGDQSHGSLGVNDY